MLLFEFSSVWSVSFPLKGCGKLGLAIVEKSQAEEEMGVQSLRQA